MIIGKLNKKSISTVVLGMMLSPAIPTATLGMDVLDSYCTQPITYWLEHSLPLEYVERFHGMTDGFALPGLLFKMRDIINEALKERNLPYFDLTKLADPRYKSDEFDPWTKRFSLTMGQVNVLGPLIGGHENFIKLEIKPENKTDLNGLQYFTNLEQFSLSNYASGYPYTSRYESIKALPMEIKDLRKLKSLILDESLLEALPPELNELPCLEFLKLTCYSFSLDPLWTMTNLRELVLCGGSVAKRYSEPNYHVIVDNFSLKELPVEIGNLVNLEVLNLEMNELQDLPGTLSCLTKLKELSLDFNRFSFLPSVIGTLMSLQKLSVKKNELEEFPEFLLNLTSLTHLDLRRNKIRNISRRIGNLSNLRALFFESNEIIKIPFGIHKLNNLVYLSLSLNHGLPRWMQRNYSWDDNCIHGIDASVNPGVTIPDFLFDQKQFYDIATKNILVILWFQQWNMLKEIGTILNGLLTELYIRDTKMYQKLHPTLEISDGCEDESDSGS